MRGHLLAAAAAASILSGCASTALQRYVGQDLDVVEARYGAPRRHFVLPNGTHAFQWVISSSRDAAASAPLDTFLPISTAPLRRREAAASRGLLLGGMCVYTILADRDAASSRWRVIGYQAPRIDCD